MSELRRAIVIISCIILLACLVSYMLHTRQPALSTPGAWTSAPTVPMPSAGQPGRYSGNLDTLTVTAEDMPVRFKPFTTSAAVAAIAGYQVPVEAQTAHYLSQYMENAGPTLTAFTDVYTWESTADAADYFNQGPLLQPDYGVTTARLRTLTKPNFYQQVVPQYEADAAQQRSWIVTVLDSNMVVEVNITATPAFTEQDLEAVLVSWAMRLGSYAPGSADELRRERASIRG